MNSKLLSCFRAVVSLVIACTLGMLSLSNASAISQSQFQNVNKQVIMIDGKKYAVSVEDKADKRVSIVKDESGKSVSAVFDKKTGKIRVNDQEIHVDNSENDLAGSTKNCWLPQSQKLNPRIRFYREKHIRFRAI